MWTSAKMGIDQSISRNGYYGMNSVHRMAVTELKENAFAFRWNVINFKGQLSNKDPKAELLSPLFSLGEEKNEPQWQLKLQWSSKEKKKDSTEEDHFLSVYLYLKNCKTPTILTTFEIDLLDLEEKSRKNLTCADREYEFTSSTNGWGSDKFLNTKDLLNPLYRLLEDNILRVQCRIVIKPKVEPKPNPPKKEIVGQTLTKNSSGLSDFSSMFIDSIFTDVVIKTKGSTLKAHKAVLSCRSRVFCVMFQVKMTESAESVVEIVDFDDDIVKMMLEYIYCVEISTEDLCEKSLKLFGIAGKYDMKGLKDLVEEAVTSSLSIKTAVDALILADMNGVLGLKSKAIKFINKNKEAVVKDVGFQKLLNYNHNPSIFKDLFLNN